MRIPLVQCGHLCIPRVRSSFLRREQPDFVEERELRRAIELSMLDCAITLRQVLVSFRPPHSCLLSAPIALVFLAPHFVRFPAFSLPPSFMVSCAKRSCSLTCDLPLHIAHPICSQVREKSALPSESAEQVLGVAKGASPSEVRAAYRARVLAAHPDKGGSPVEFQRIERAYRRIWTGKDDLEEQELGEVG